MEVHPGTLFEWPTAKRVYEVKEYRPEENVAVANWRESIAGSQLAGDCLVADAIDHIEEIRTVLEPEAQKSRRLQRRIRSIIRKLDRRRMEDQQEILDPTTTPSFGKSGATVSEVVAEEVPEGSETTVDESRQRPDERTRRKRYSASTCSMTAKPCNQTNERQNRSIRGGRIGK